MKALNGGKGLKWKDWVRRIGRAREEFKGYGGGWELVCEADERGLDEMPADEGEGLERGDAFWDALADEAKGVL